MLKPQASRGKFGCAKACSAHLKCFKDPSAIWPLLGDGGHDELEWCVCVCVSVCESLCVCLVFSLVVCVSQRMYSEHRLEMLGGVLLAEKRGGRCVCVCVCVCV